VRIAAIAWLALNPWAIEQGTNGLETAFALFVLAAACSYHVGALQHGTSKHFPIWSGALIGLTALARTELALVPLAFLIAVLRRPSASMRAAPGKAIAVAATVVAPWVAYSLCTTGEVVQSSATAMMFILWRVPLVGGLKSVTPSIALERSLHSFRDGVDLVTEFMGTGAMLGCALLAAAVVAWIAAPASSAVMLAPRRRALAPLWASLGVLFMLFTAVRLYFETWHTAPFVWCVLVSLAAVADAYDAKRLACAVTVVVLGVAYATIPTRLKWNLVDASAERAARTDCGEDAYVSRDRITNIDGVVNNVALAALRAGRLLDYVETLHPEYLFLDGYYHSSIFLGARYRERLTARDDSPELLRLATAVQKDDRIRVSAPLAMNSARGREVLSDGWLWDTTAQSPDVRSVGEWSELIVVVPRVTHAARVELELSAMVIPEGSNVQGVRVSVDGGEARSLKVPRQRIWLPIDVPTDDRRHRIRLTYESPKLRVERDPGARWWWRGVSYQVNAVRLWGIR
jgi:hypothetical protein